MSGTLPQYRPGNRPTGHIKLDNYAGGEIWKHRLVPSGFWANGRPREYLIAYEPVMAHVLDYSPQPHYPSKHARARIRPRTDKERRRMAAVNRRAIQASKSITVDINALSMVG